MKDQLRVDLANLQKLSQALPSPFEMRKTILFKDYTVVKISDLQVQYSFLQWQKLFALLTGYKFPGGTLIQVYFPNYFAVLFEELHNLPKWKINNALVAIYAGTLYENLVTPQAKNNREDYCLRLSTKLFRDISSKLYMNSWPISEMQQSQKFVVDIFELLKKHLETSVSNADWLDDESKISILFKISKMEMTLNNVNDLYNLDVHLDRKYKDIVLLNNDFIYNAIEMLLMDRTMMYKLVGKTMTVNYLWSHFVNNFDHYPTSFYSNKLILAPLGIIKQHAKGYPGYLTLARIGLALAREIGRHFDPVGIRYGATLSPKSKISYDAMKATMENESLFNIIKHVWQQTVVISADPTLSVNERIADNTAIRLITESFPNFKTESLLPWIHGSFSKEQIFFLTIAQEYCKKTDIADYMLQLYESEELPPSMQVENIVTNSREFSDTFKCAVGSTMNNNHAKVQFPNLENKSEDIDEIYP